MSEQETPSTEESTTEETVETPLEGETPKGEETESTEGGTEETGETVPPEVLRKKLTDANAEAANYRTKLREVETRFADAKTADEFETAVADLKAQNDALERTLLLTKVAGKYELPPVLADVLKGDDEATLEAHAKELQKLLAPEQPQSLAGGLDPEDDDEDFDPVKAVQAARRNRY